MSQAQMTLKKISLILTGCLQLTILEFPHFLIMHFCTQSIFFYTGITRTLNIAENQTTSIYIPKHRFKGLF